nr:unnamed protein product [Callosobruchus analis]
MLFNTRKKECYNPESIYAFVQRKSEMGNIGRLHPMVVGHILHKKLKQKNIVQISQVGKNRVKVQLSTIEDANSLVCNSLLAQENLKAFIPNHLLTKKGIIAGVDTQFNDEYLMENICSGIKVIGVNRFMRKVDGNSRLVPRQLVVVSFEGNKLPSRISIDSVMFTVEPYVPKVIQCFKCLRYGHVASQCRSSTSFCHKCAKPLEDGHSCADEDRHCLYCNSNEHNTISKSCPQLAKQKSIKNFMIHNNSTFTDAKNAVEKSYVGVLTANPFSPLQSANRYETQFPSLSSSRRQTRVPSAAPTTSRAYYNSQNNDSRNKKRVNSSPIQTPGPEPMFPFRFGPPQTIFSWNARSAVANKQSLKQFLGEHDIDVALISETLFQPNRVYTFSGYNIVRNDRFDGRAGTAIFVKKGLRFTEKLIDLRSINEEISLCVVELYLPTNELLTLASLYRPPQTRTTTRDWRNCFNLLEEPYIIGGDVNGHNMSWGSPRTDGIGSQVMEAVEESNLVVLNTGEATRSSSPNEQKSVVDVTICSSVIAFGVTWEVVQDTLGSDHYPILLQMNVSNESTIQPKSKWNIKFAKWDLYNVINEQLFSTIPPEFQNTESKHDWFLNNINTAAEASIPIKKPFKLRKDALRAYKNASNFENFVNCKKAIAKVKKNVQCQG